MDLADPDSRSGFKDINKQQAAKLAADFSLGFIEFILNKQISTQEQEVIFEKKNSQLDTPNLQEVSLKLRELLIRIATGGTRDRNSNNEYTYLRNIILSNDIPKEKIPTFVRISDSIEKFWSFIRTECEKYKERRKLLRDAFQVLNEWLSSS